MKVCHCNVLNDDDINVAIANNLEIIKAAKDLLEAVVIVHKSAIDAQGKTLCSRSCTVCFNRIAAPLQEAGLFVGETLPKPTFCNTCPRRLACGLC